MARQSVTDLWSQISELHKEINKRSSCILQIRRVIEEITLRIPQGSSPQLTFYQTITWLYVFYLEAGRLSFRFLIERLPTYHLDDEQVHREHYADVRRIRTFLQHNLNVDSKRDLELQRRCEEWFLSRCGSAMPDNDTEWNRCLESVLGASVSFLEAVVTCIEEIEKDESSDMIARQWTARLTRTHSKADYEAIVSKVANDVGQNSLDASQLTDRHYEQWSRELRSRSENYRFETEARKLIERTLLSDYDPPLPITGEDVMREFGIPPGPEVGRLLRRARIIYLDQPSDVAELVAKLKQS